MLVTSTLVTGWDFDTDTGDWAVDAGTITVGTPARYGTAGVVTATDPWEGPGGCVASVPFTPPTVGAWYRVVVWVLGDVATDAALYVYDPTAGENVGEGEPTVLDGWTMLEVVFQAPGDVVVQCVATVGTHDADATVMCLDDATVWEVVELSATIPVTVTLTGVGSTVDRWVDPQVPTLVAGGSVTPPDLPDPVDPPDPDW